MKENTELIISVVTAIIELIGCLFNGIGTELLKNWLFKKQYTSKTADFMKSKPKSGHPVQRILHIFFPTLFLISVISVGYLFIQSRLNKPPVDESEAFAWYLEQVQNPDEASPKNLNALGECYLWGRGTDINYNEAFSCFKKAAESGNSNAQYNLAVCYTYGYGTDIDDVQALEYFQLAENNIADAKAFVGYYYYCGWGGLKIDKAKAFELFRISENKGSIMSLYFQALYYLLETEVEDHYTRAIELCQRAINAGCTSAFGPLGLCYFEEDSPMSNPVLAYDYFRKGAEAENDIALYELAAC